jgi:hypothetical protein
MATEYDRIQNRVDTAINWASANPILLKGEIGFESDDGKFKFGDGATAWNDLSYALPENYSALINRPIISVKDFGAKGDGTTDDTSAIQSALNSLLNDSSLYFPVGTYLVSGLSINSSSSTIRKSRITLFGDGFGTQVSLKNSANSDLILADNCPQLTIKGLCFDGNKSNNTSGNGVVIQRSEFSIIDKVCSSSRNVSKRASKMLAPIST